MKESLNVRSLWAVARRQLGTFLGNPLGYVFIFAFVLIAGAIAFLPDVFFERNLADFSGDKGLNLYMPWLLAVLMPALAMTSWAQEREQGTEELLLTLPVSVPEAVLGKYLAIALFFTIAMVFNGSNVISLAVLGTPDWGQMLATMLGWFVYGLAFAALAFLGSALVANAAIAFVLGLVLCSILAGAAWWYDLTQAFGRGLLPLGQVLAILAVAGGALVLAMLAINARRWQRRHGELVFWQTAHAVLAILLVVNLVRIAQRNAWESDLSVERLSSISNDSIKLLSELKQPATVHVFVSDRSVLPEVLLAKAQEITDKSQAIARSSGGQVTVTIHRPVDRLDEQGTLAEQYGLRTRPDMAKTVAGQERVEIYLGAVIEAGSKLEKIDYFDPGLSVEYELVRAIRAAVIKAETRPDVKIRVVVPKEVPPSLKARVQAVEEWCKVQRPGVIVTRVESSDPEADADKYRLDVKSVPKEDVKPEEKKDDKKEGDKKDDAKTPPVVATVKIVLGAVAEGPKNIGRVRYLADDKDVAAKLNDAVNQARRMRPVLGVLQTELSMNGGEFDQQTMRGAEPWTIMSEFERQYEVRSIQPDNLDPEKDEDVAVLLVGMPSMLSPEQLEKLYQWIWRGHPTILLDDPHPFSPLMETGKALHPGEERPNKNRNPMMMGMQQPPPSGPPKAGIEGMRTFYEGLGIDVDLGKVVWSDFNPSFMYRTLPKGYLWMFQDQGCVPDDPITKGIQGVISIFGGTLKKRSDATTEVSPLLKLSGDHSFGSHHYKEYLPMAIPGFMQPQIPQSYIPQSSTSAPIVAARLSGPIKQIYGYKTKHGNPYGGDEAKEGSTTDTGVPLIKKGAQSPQGINVVVVLDVDFASNQFYQIYRQVIGRNEIPPEVNKLRNIQFLQNAVDVLAGDQALVNLRARRHVPHILTRIAQEVDAARKKTQEAEDKARKEMKDALEDAKGKLEEEINELRKRNDIDTRAKEQFLVIAQETANKRLKGQEQRINENGERDIRRAQAELRNKISDLRQRIRIMILALPALALALLILAVVGHRLFLERTDIPASRQRRK